VCSSDLAGIFWAIRNGQFDDMEGPAQRILMDEDDPMIPRRTLRDGEK
jgi:cbb3-type cytochrome oxidase maturation protein